MLASLFIPHVFLSITPVDCYDKIKAVTKAKSPFHIMVKPRGPVCNLACDYCYYLPKANLYPQSEFRMSGELLTEYTRQMFASQPGKAVNFTWQGGEPTLMGLDFYEEAVRLQKEFAPPGVQVTNTLQTNGTQLNPAWCRFFKENNFLIGLSLDGPPEFHNTFRHDRAGREQYDAVMRGLDLLQQQEVDFNVLCSVHQANVHHPLEVYQFLRDRVGAAFIQFIPILQRELDQDGRETETLTSLSVDGDSYGNFLISIFDEWVHRDVGKVFIQHFDVALGIYAGQSAGLCIFSETCGRALVLEHNGDLYSCDHFVDPVHYLGNITEIPLSDMVDSETQFHFGETKHTALPEVCLACEVRFLCNGGCPKNRDVNGLNHLCAGYKAFFTHIDQPMRLMVDLLETKQTAG